MKNLHAKSLCCGGRIIRYGRRRKQCVFCKRTWRLRKKKTGRKRKRTDKQIVIKYLSGMLLSPAGQAKIKKRNSDNFERKLIRSRDIFIRNTSWPDIPAGNLILIADAFVQIIEKQWHTAYVLFVRSICEEKAVILPIFWKTGTETSIGWNEALNAVPESVKDRILALVCDGHRGLVNYAHWRGWPIQRCHFHLIARIQGRRSKWKTGRHAEEAKRIFELVNIVLKENDEKCFRKALAQIEEMGWETKSPELKKTISGFVKNYRDFRTYLSHQELNLPTTSNTAESFIGLIRNLLGKAKGFRTLESFKKWTDAFAKQKQNIFCRKNQPS